MIDLQAERPRILSFLGSVLTRVRQDQPDYPVRHVGLYCCPWSGWVSLCIDSLEHIEQNCPDFEQVEVATYEAPSWAEEYESVDCPAVRTHEGQILELDVESEGDEAMNRVFFEFLCELLSSRPAITSLRSFGCDELRVGVQLLDSTYNRSWVLAAA